MASSVAAFASRLCTHPLDTLKTRVQVSNTPLPLLPTFASLVKNGGLYRGLPIALTLSVPGLSVYLTAYDLSKGSFSRYFPHLGADSVVNHMASAVVAEVSSGLFWTPMEVLKSKQQVENMSLSKTTVSALPSKASSIPTTSLSKTSSPLACSASTTASSTPRLGSIAISASSSSSFSTTTTTAMSKSTPTLASTPTPPPNCQPTPISTFELAKRIYRQEGLLGFYRGYFITLGVFVPYSMIYFATYEQLKEMAWHDQHLFGSAVQPSKQREEALPFLTIVACAAVAAGIAGGISNIVDVVKTRWQISVLATTEENSSTGKIIQHMFRQGGLSSFTRGMGARILWMIPSVTISMSTFEWLKAHGFAV
ncbi:hypothetical protein EDD11_006245 [Mortierella claussenii]|nr:hypothetical protein EDD11_006245 [Mortierella claussenii]